MWERVFGLSGESGPALIGHIDWHEVSDRGLAASDLCEWSHNGIRLPDPELDLAWISLLDHQWKSDGKEGRVTGSVFASFWLTDQLRPGLDIARSTVNTVPFRLYSSINLAVRRSLNQPPEMHHLREVGNIAVEGIYAPRPGWKLSEILADPLMHHQNGWVSQLVLQMDNQGDVSALDIRRTVGETGECVVQWPGSSGFYAGEVDAHLLRALMSIYLDFAVDDTTGAIKVRSSSTPRLDPRLEPYPPGIFLPYLAGNETLVCVTDRGHNQVSSRPPNLYHELIEWFLQVSMLLQGRAPALEIEFLATLDKVKDHINAVDPLADLRKVVDRIGVVVSGSGGTPFAGDLSKSCIKVVPAWQD